MAVGLSAWQKFHFYCSLSFLSFFLSSLNATLMVSTWTQNHLLCKRQHHLVLRLFTSFSKYVSLLFGNSKCNRSLNENVSFEMCVCLCVRLLLGNNCNNATVIYFIQLGTKSFVKLFCVLICFSSNKYVIAI